MIASAVISGVTAAAGLGAGIYGSVQSAKKARESKAAWEAGKSEDEKWFNKQYYQNWTDRTEVQDTLRRAAEQQRVAQNRADAQAAITGATDEVRLATQDNINKNYSDTVSKIASNLSMLRDQTLNNYRNRMNVLNSQYVQMLGNESNQYGTMASNGFNTMGSAAGNMLGSLGRMYGWDNPTTTPNE